MTATFVGLYFVMSGYLDATASGVMRFSSRPSGAHSEMTPPVSVIHSNSSPDPSSRNSSACAFGKRSSRFDTNSPAFV